MVTQHARHSIRRRKLVAASYLIWSLLAVSVVAVPHASAATTPIATVAQFVREVDSATSSKVPSAASLEERAARMAKKLGAARSDIRVVKPKRLARIKGASDKVSAVRWQRFARGVLVEITMTKKVKTFAVVGKIGKKYQKSSGPLSKWGIPRADARCKLLDSGCVQHFSAGTVYASKRTSTPSFSQLKGAKGEVEAALRSWIGYRVTWADNSSTPIQKWMGSSQAWCGYFQTWGFYASGSADLLPAKKKLIPFANMRSTVQREMKVGQRPKVGALAFVRTERGRDAGHVGFVSQVTKTKIRLVHGNTTGNGKVRYGYRGVVESWVDRSTVAFFAYPEY